MFEIFLNGISIERIGSYSEMTFMGRGSVVDYYISPGAISVSLLHLGISAALSAAVIRKEEVGRT